MKQVLVTGGAGFIGSHLVDQLVAQASTVIVLDDFSTGARVNLKDAEASGRLRVIAGSILKPDDLESAIAGCDTVFHLAVKSVRHSLGHPLENHAVNAGGTLAVLEASRRAGIRRVVYCSSSEVYGNAADEVMREDRTLCRPVTVYGAGKLAGEHYAAAYHQTYGLHTVIVRPFNAYGPRSHLLGDAGEVIPRFFARILADQAPIVFGEGRQTRDFTYVADTVRAIARAGIAQEAVGSTINIAFGCATSVRDLARHIAAVCGKPHLEPVFYPARPGDVKALRADVERCNRILGFAPAVDLQQGLGLYKGWFESAHAGASLVPPETQNWVIA